MKAEPNEQHLMAVGLANMIQAWLQHNRQAVREELPQKLNPTDISRVAEAAINEMRKILAEKQ